MSLVSFAYRTLSPRVQFDFRSDLSGAIVLACFTSNPLGTERRQSSLLATNRARSSFFAIAQHYDAIYAADDNRLGLVYRDRGHDLDPIVQHNSGGFWSVTTAIPLRVARFKRLIAEIPRVGRSESLPKVAVPSRFATLTLSKGRPFGDSES